MQRRKQSKKSDKSLYGIPLCEVEADFEIDPAAFREVAVYSDIRTRVVCSCWRIRSESVISCTLVYERDFIDVRRTVRHVKNQVIPEIVRLISILQCI